MQRKDIDKNLQEKKQQEEKKGKVTTKVYKTTKETPNYKESKVEIISNQTIENPPEITRTSNIYQTSTGREIFFIYNFIKTDSSYFYIHNKFHCNFKTKYKIYMIKKLKYK